MKRRTFISGAATILLTPSIVRSASLDYVPRGILIPERVPFEGPTYSAGFGLAPIKHEGGVLVYDMANQAWIRSEQGWTRHRD